MALEKLTIWVESASGKFDQTIVALFNPNELSIGKSAQWKAKPKAERDTPESQFTHGDPATLSMELFFDTYESQKDVRSYTSEIFKLTTIQGHGNLHRPPLCRLGWGRFNISETFDCNWVLTNLNQRFTLFLADGTPVRATLVCSFIQYRGDEIEEKLLKKESVDVAKTRVIHAGDTLSSIAAEEYNDPSLWRPIARMNRIINPAHLPIGTVLRIPPLTGGETLE